jgi:hypothetical protein
MMTSKRPHSSADSSRKQPCTSDVAQDQIVSDAPLFDHLITKARTLRARKEEERITAVCAGVDHSRQLAAERRVAVQNWLDDIAKLYIRQISASNNAKYIVNFSSMIAHRRIRIDAVPIPNGFDRWNICRSLSARLTRHFFHTDRIVFIVRLSGRHRDKSTTDCLSVEAIAS